MMVKFVRRHGEENDSRFPPSQSNPSRRFEDLFVLLLVLVVLI